MRRRNCSHIVSVGWECVCMRVWCRFCVYYFLYCSLAKKKKKRKDTQKQFIFFSVSFSCPSLVTCHCLLSSLYYLLAFSLLLPTHGKTHTHDTPSLPPSPLPLSLTHTLTHIHKYLINFLKSPPPPSTPPQGAYETPPPTPSSAA
jgi:hypothetical protein